MSMYVARSPYKSFSRPRFKITFPNFRNFFAGRAARRDRKAARIVPTSNIAAPASRAALRAVSRAGRVSVLSSLHSSRAASGAAIGNAVKRVREATLRFEFGPSAAIGGLLLIAVLLSLFYLTHFNKVATKGYDLRRLEADRQQLLNQYEIKNMKLAEVKSLSRIAGSERAGAMRRPNEIIFVRGNTALASR